MPYSQNGWLAIESGSDPRLVRIPKIIGKVLGGAVALIFTDLVEQFDTHVEDVDLGADDWGYAYREVRAGASLSNHASGTAIDLNATRHPLGRKGTFSATQVAAIRTILARYKGVVRWGGDYSGRKDEMHFEIVGNAPHVIAVAVQLEQGSGGASILPPTPAPSLPVNPNRKAPLMYIITRIGDEAAYLVGPTSMIQLTFDQAQAYLAMGVPLTRLNPAQVLAVMQAVHYSAADEDNTQAAYRG